MRKILVAAAGSALILFGIAAVAHSSATIDLIWESTGTDTFATSGPRVIQLNVILTAGPAGSDGASVSVDFSSVGRIAFQTGFFVSAFNTPSEELDGPLPLMIDDFPDLDTEALRVERINSICICSLGAGVGLAAGQSHQLGTVRFDISRTRAGIYEIRSTVEGSGGVIDGDTQEIPTEEIAFNNAFLEILSDPPFGRRIPRWKHPR